MEEEKKFHWSEGMKYVAEAVKALLLINGAAAVSVLTFLGTSKASSTPLVIAMLCFALGAVASPVTFSLAYLTQLNYGNDKTGSSWLVGVVFHKVAYVPFVAGILLFLIGISFAACGLGSVEIQDSQIS